MLNPLEWNPKLGKLLNLHIKGEEETEEKKLFYSELIDSLTFPAVTTRRGICFALSRLGQFNDCFGKRPWSLAQIGLRI